MSDYTEFFLNSKSSVAQFETLEISHPYFSQTYWVVRNKTTGLTATLEDARVITFDYYPLRIQFLGTRDTLDWGIKVNLGDLGEVIPQEIDNVLSAE